MGKLTGISWCHHTFNPWHGCLKVSDGCKHCYAHTWSVQHGQANIWGPAAIADRRLFGDKHWGEPIGWDRTARVTSVRRRVFCGSMCDWAEDHPTLNMEREKLWPLIRATQSLDWLLLTKRPERIQQLLPNDWGHGYPNVWLGTSIEDMRVAWRLDRLKRIPAVVRFVSYEPALGPLDKLKEEDVARR